MSMTNGLAAFNRERSERAATRNIERAKAAMTWMMGQPSGSTPHAQEWQNRHFAALRARVANPESTLAEIAERIGITKDTYSARLRRAIRIAERAELADL